MKRISIILMAFALTMTMSQCKKNEGQTTSNDEVVTITLDVKQNNGSKVVVNPNTGTVDFETGDKLYVGSGGKYVGFLTHNGTNFSGNITNPTENQPLQLYFLGNVTPQETLSAGTTNECSVIISDQTEHLPVISCAASNENYVSGVTAYSAHLLNKCALVKFNVTTPSSSPICITGMKNKVTVDFSNNTLTPSKDGEGVITLPAGGGENVEKWAILLPQEALEEGLLRTLYSQDGEFLGMRPEIPLIPVNGYFFDGINLTINIESFPIGAINGLFSINDNGDQVYFSQGNLQYIGSAASPYWKFADNQWDYLGDNGQASESSLVDRDLFGWGTSGYHDVNDPFNVNYLPWSVSNAIVHTSYNYYGYGPSTRMTDYNLSGTSANYDWGVYNSICNGGNLTNTWRTLTYDEWRYMFFTRETLSGIRYAKAQVNNIDGVILLPDDWSVDIYPLNKTNNQGAFYDNNIITSLEWNTLENAGAVFLPAAGYRNSQFFSNIGPVGNYWSSWCDYNGSPSRCTDAYLITFSNSEVRAVYSFRFFGYSVRLVQDYNP